MVEAFGCSASDVLRSARLPRSDSSLVVNTFVDPQVLPLRPRLPYSGLLEKRCDKLYLCKIPVGSLSCSCRGVSSRDSSFDCGRA